MGRWWWPTGYPQLLLVALVGVLCLSVAVAGVTSAAAFGAYNTKWDGAAQLRDVADEQGAAATLVTDVSEYRDTDPNGTVAVILSPEEPYTPTERATVSRFVEEGGTLVVAEDYGPHGNDVLAATRASTRVDGRPLRDERRHDASPAFPIADGVADHEVTSGVDHLTLNHGTVLTTADGTPVGTEATVLVNTSEYAYLDADQDGDLDDQESLESRPVAAVESVGDGRVIVVSDPSAFINAMLERPGNDQFVANVFGAHERILLDYSHVTGHPPLVAAMLALQKSSVLTFLVGMLGLLVVSAVGAPPDTRARVIPLVGRVGRRASDQSSADHQASPVNEEALLAYLREQHPDWDQARIERVMTGVIGRRPRNHDNE